MTLAGSQVNGSKTMRLYYRFLDGSEAIDIGYTNSGGFSDGNGYIGLILRKSTGTFSTVDAAITFSTNTDVSPTLSLSAESMVLSLHAEASNTAYGAPSSGNQLATENSGAAPFSSSQQISELVESGATSTAVTCSNGNTGSRITAQIAFR